VLRRFLLATTPALALSDGVLPWIATGDANSISDA
jgi:hypothetical protein